MRTRKGARNETENHFLADHLLRDHGTGLLRHRDPLCARARASTNLNDQFPWGIWIGFDVLCGVCLQRAGSLLTAAVHIFNIKRLHAIVRPTILTAFLGYVLVSRRTDV